MVCFFFKQKTAYEMRISDWSSDVCSSDLPDHLRSSGICARCRRPPPVMSPRHLGICPDVRFSRLRRGWAVLVASKAGLGERHGRDRTEPRAAQGSGRTAHGDGGGPDADGVDPPRAVDVQLWLHHLQGARVDGRSGDDPEPPENGSASWREQVVHEVEILWVSVTI